MEFQDLIFIGDIILQAKIAQRASERLNSTNENFDRLEVWCSIQSILAAVGNVSKILWPSYKYKIRGERLRQILSVEEKNLLSNRKFRNHFEHYDERIEEWFESCSGGVYVDLAMNPCLSGNMNCHRGYNSFNNTLIFRGASFDLAEVLNALDEISEKCKPYVLTEIY